MLDKHFNFANKEAGIYRKWEEAGVFKVENSGQEAEKPSHSYGAPAPRVRSEASQLPALPPVFNITMPPPNANGELHIGHCYGHTIMDILGRYHRLKGDRVLLIPGKDHAGIQTQVVYERKLRAEGVDVEKMTRDEFWKSCYQFCVDRSAYMRAQEKLIGTGADFDKEIFTLEEGVSKIVYETFEKMWKDGLVYRGNRIVNWSIYSQTSISDVEVEYKEEPGHLWHIKYPLLETVKKPDRKRIQLDELGAVELLHNTGNHWVVLLESEVELKIGEVLIKKDRAEEVEIERDFVIFKINDFSGEKIKPELLEKYNEKIREKILESPQVTILEIVPELDQNDCIIVATTRPETMLGDTAVAVNPADPRYEHLTGKSVRVPECGREIKIIADDRIDIGFGTGAVKITPAHDFLDYEIGRDHGLEQIQVIDKFGLMTEAAGEQYQGMKILDCREALIKNLAKDGYLLLTEEITHKVPISERGKDVVEPMISTQWFVEVDKEGLSLKKRALDLINSGRIKVYPERLKDQMIQWLNNLNDWNISRQILWGHRMPVWYKNKDTDKEEIQVGVAAPAGQGWEQETDTFDTWFSSGQWPYSTLASLGLLDLENIGASDFFPTHTMVMGRDILLFWACRMLLFSAYRFNEIPWKNIYFTGLIRDAKGQKMSKSKGNGVEPKEMLAKYGADALRVGLIAGSTAGQDIKFNEKKIDSFAKFLNKIWNAAKLVAQKGEGDYQLALPESSKLKLSSSAWILEYVDQVQQEYCRRLENYEISNAFDIIYHFSWDIFCSWYLEMAKIELEVASEHTEEIKSVMFAAFGEILKMLHPFMPFFTEEIHESMEKLGDSKLLASRTWMDFSNYRATATADSDARISVQKLIDLVSVAREIRISLEKPFSETLTLEIEGKADSHYPQLLKKLANADLAEVKEGIVKPSRSGIIRIAATRDEKSQFRDSLEKTLAKKEAELKVLETILTPGFKEKADPDLVAEREVQFQRVSEEVSALRQELAHN